MPKTLYITDRQKWRSWLAQNHDRHDHVWLIYYKKGSGKPRISYDDAVEEAICYGWIDSLVKRLDDKRYMQKFTPRTDTGTWSALNVRRVRKLHELGKLTRAALAKIPESIFKGKTPKPTVAQRRSATMPTELKRLIGQDTKATAYLKSLAPSYQHQFIGWVGSAKKADTRVKRAKEAVQLLAQGKKLGLK